MSNPWKARHIGAETVFQGGDFNLAATLVDREYQGREQSEDKCGICGADAYYRATVGAVQCPDCSALLIVRIDQTTKEVTERWVK